MSDQFTDSLIDSSRFGSSISGETRALMSQMLDFDETDSADASRSQGTSAPIPIDRVTDRTLPGLTTSPNPPSLPPQTQSPQMSIHTSVVPSLLPLVGRMIEELETHPTKLLSLNPSRRESIAEYLARLSGHSAQAAPSAQPGSLGQPLRRWIEGNRSASQVSALRAFFEEVAIFTLAQAIVLKRWSDRGIRKWSATDLGRLNWALSTTLRPQIPLDREGWQVTKPNLYSWYNPAEQIQQEIWNALEPWKLQAESPSFLSSIAKSLRKTHGDAPESQGYDSRFYKTVFEQLEAFGFNPNPESTLLRRPKTVFCPTLRDGSLVRSAPSALQWVGLEPSCFQFLIGELLQIWWGPVPPPVWCIGNGLEVHTRDQLTFSLQSSKPSVLCRIAEMEACDIAFVLEEQVVRLQGRNPISTRFKEQVESLPYFKKLKSAGTSMGDLQACVALNKLRPNGLLWWAREESLNAKDGRELLNFLLDRAKLIGEWDFSDLEHSLPLDKPLFPKNLYLFQRENHLETRLSHRPIRYSVTGNLRSHVEVSLVLEDALQTPFREVQPRGQWSILTYPSPSPQREWIDKWPDPASQSEIRHLDLLRASSLPLANFATIRPTPEGDSSPKGAWSLSLPLRGFWLCGEADQDGRKLSIRPLPGPGQQAQGSGLMVLLPDENWVGPLSIYFTSELVHNWLDHHAERRGEKWILNEQVVKWIPVPKTLLRLLGVPSAIGAAGGPIAEHIPLSAECEALIQEAAFHPAKVKQELLKCSESGYPVGAGDPVVHAQIFLQVAKALDYLHSGQNRLLSLVSSDGKIRWGALLEILPKTELVPLSVHPKVRMTGSLPPHFPIGKFERVKSPMAGILFSTETGFTLHVGSESTLLLNIIWDQLQGLENPTWSELVQFLRIPRKIELAESTAMDVLNSHSEQLVQHRELQDLLNCCKMY
ncbi:MAG: hypothetical protein HYX41_02945 [Bdellovibrio sp.]|nr:hypothetical protein [Bdellovibrio sp.]